MSLLDALEKGLIVKFGSDISGLVTGIEGVEKKFDLLGDTVDGFDNSWNKMGLSIREHSKEIALGMTSAGVAIVALTDDAKKTNSELAGTAITLGTTTSAMRDLALATSDAGFPLDDTIATLDLLARAGVRGDEQIKSISMRMDTLGDATGNTAAGVTSSLIPALNAFDIPLSEVGDHIDGLTYLTKNSTIELSDFTGTMSSLGPKLSAIGLTMEDSEAIMLALSDAGYQGTAATKIFRTAVSESDGDLSKLYTSLGITKEAVAGYKTEIDGAAGLTDKYAAAADSAIGTTDQVTSIFNELKLSVGSALEPLNGVGTALTIGGPLLLGLTQLPAMITGVNTAFTFLAANPIVLAIAAIVIVAIILETKFGLLSKAAELLGQGWSWLSDNVISPFIGWLSEAVKGVDWMGIAFMVLLTPIWLVVEAIKFLGNNWETIWTGMESIAQGTASIITGIYDTMIGGIKGALNIGIDGINTMIRGINMVHFDKPDWLGGGSVGFNIAQIPRLAAGGIVTSPTIAMIGEAGPEAVVPLTGRNAGAGGITITGNTFVVRNDNDIQLIARELYNLTTRENRGRGSST